MANPEAAPIVVMLVVTEAPKARGAPGARESDSEGYSPRSVNGMERLTIVSRQGWLLMLESWTELHVLSRGTMTRPISRTL